MLVPSKEIGQQLASLALRYREYTKSEIEYVDRSSVIKVPAMPNLSG